MMLFTPFRTEPKMDVSAYKSYEYRLPRGTHTRKASCEEVGCEAYRLGWKTTLDLTTHRDHALWVINESGRHGSHEIDGMLITFTFPRGQQCFRTHHVPTRPGIYTVRDGDWRGNPSGSRWTMSAESWLDDFGEHQQTLYDQQQKG